MRKQQVIELWKSVFDDSPAFIKLYFEHVYKEENTLTIEQDGRVVAALQMLPYQMNYYGKEISVAYISGASTLSSEQGKGLMRKLLQQAFVEMKQRNIPLTALIPAEEWLFDYYQSQGYTTVFDYTIEHYVRPKQIIPFPGLSIADHGLLSPQELFAYFDSKLRERPISMLHSFDDFNTIREDLSIAGGRLFTVVHLEKEPVAMGFASPINQENGLGRIYLKELLYNDPNAKAYLLQSIAQHYNANQISFSTPCAKNENALRSGMVKILDPEQVMGLWTQAHPPCDLSLDQIRAMTPEQQSQHLFDYAGKTAYMSLMLD